MRKLAVLLTFAFLFLASANAQQPQPQGQQPFTLKVDTQLVVETVIVRDKDGKPIEGLTDKDFVVTEDNIPQTISVRHPYPRGFPSQQHQRPRRSLW
jgi:hypothetical protein